MTSDWIDVTDYSLDIRREARRRYDNNQLTGIEQMTNKVKAWEQHLIGTAGEVAARIVLGMNPYAIAEDEIGAPDIITPTGVKMDIKVVRDSWRHLNVQHFPGLFDRKGDWNIGVMLYEGIGWRFRPSVVFEYSYLKGMPIHEAQGGHRSAHYKVDIDKLGLTLKRDTP